MIFLKKRPTLIIGVIIGAIFGILILIRSSGVFNWWEMGTNVMEPNIHKNSTFFTSNVSRIKNGDIIIYRTEDSPIPSVYRVIGMESDTISVQNGVVVRNGKKADKEYEIIYDYMVPKKEFLNIYKSKDIYHSYTPIQISYIDTFFIATKKEYAHLLKLQRFIQDKNHPGKYIHGQFDEKWNGDNFGPVVIPKGKYFVMGDNRGNSLDSRHVGFIDNKSVLGKIIF